MGEAVVILRRTFSAAYVEIILRDSRFPRVLFSVMCFEREGIVRGKTCKQMAMTKTVAMLAR